MYRVIISSVSEEFRRKMTVLLDTSLKDPLHSPNPLYSGDGGKIFYDWGEEFVISFDFEASFYPTGVTNILHIYDKDLDDGEEYYFYGEEPTGGYGRVIPGCKTF